MVQKDEKAFWEKWLTRFLLHNDPIETGSEIEIGSECLLAELMKVEAEANVS